MSISGHLMVACKGNGNGTMFLFRRILHIPYSGWPSNTLRSFSFPSTNVPTRVVQLELDVVSERGAIAMEENEHPVWAELRDMQAHERVSAMILFVEKRSRRRTPQQHAVIKVFTAVLPRVEHAQARTSRTPECNKPRLAHLIS